MYIRIMILPIISERGEIISYVCIRYDLIKFKIALKSFQRELCYSHRYCTVCTVTMYQNSMV